MLKFQIQVSIEPDLDLTLQNQNWFPNPEILTFLIQEYRFSSVLLKIQLGNRQNALVMCRIGPFSPTGPQN